MKTAGGRFSLISLCSLAIAVQVSGCAVGTKSFSMDSVSRMPFFSFELRERKKKNSGTSVREIQRSSRDLPRIEPAIGIGSSTKLQESAIASVTESTSNATSSLSELSNKQPDCDANRSLVFPVNIRSSKDSKRTDQAVPIDFN